MPTQKHKNVPLRYGDDVTLVSEYPIGELSIDHNSGASRARAEPHS